MLRSFFIVLSIIFGPLAAHAQDDNNGMSPQGTCTELTYTFFWEPHNQPSVEKGSHEINAFMAMAMEG